jgi:hypothetical protein
VTDWRKILVAYISHIKDCEGVVYYPKYGVGGTAVETDLTDEERSALLFAVNEALRMP